MTCFQPRITPFQKMTSQSNYRLWGKASGGYPIYMINGSLLDGPDQDAAGFFFVDIDDKLVQMKINMTPGMYIY